MNVNVYCVFRFQMWEGREKRRSVILSGSSSFITNKNFLHDAQNFCVAGRDYVNMNNIANNF